MDLYTRAEKVVSVLKQQERTLITLESCTGGMLASVLTSVPGVSDVFLEGLVCYSNNAKIRRLGVDPDTLSEKGAVSEEIAEQMVKGGLLVPETSEALSITGIAGPTGGTEQKPIGTVWFGYGAQGEEVTTIQKSFEGNREDVRTQSVDMALRMLGEVGKAHKEK